MNSKRLLTLMLAFCLVFGALAPAAGAVQFAPADSASKVQQGEDASTGNWLSDFLVSVGEVLGIRTLKDDQKEVLNKDNLSFVNGKWVATTANGVSIELTDAQLPEHIKALREAAEHYAEQDVVYAFVVLEGDPTAELYSSINEVPAALTASLNAQQNNLISVIEKEILGGEKLHVVSRFTHLTNSVVVSTQFGNLEAIAALQGVKSVFLSPVYKPCETSSVVAPATTSATVMTNVASVWQELGYTGKGMTIAVLDTGLDLDHPSFAADPAGASWTAEWVQELLDTYDLQAEALYKGVLTADDLYYSAKVPFAFNYALGNTNVSHNDGLGDHGTHVAGIAAANNVEGSGVVGMAPDAQIIAMKVFNSKTGGSNMYDLIKAMEDCLTMGIDVVNMSLGSPAGFSQSEIEEIDSIFERISESDIIVDVAAGNEGTSSYSSSFGPFMQLTDNIDNATISSPSTYANAMSIASVDNNYVASSYFALPDGTKVFYMACAEYHTGVLDFNLEILADQDLEYVIIPGLGEEADFYAEDGTSLVEGKVAVISRGTTTFAEKATNAENAGAVGVLIWDNVSEDIFTFGMSVEKPDGTYPAIPVALISLEDGQVMADAAEKRMTVSVEAALRLDANGGQMSSFSCWGVTPDLRLLPDVAGVGGNVYSCYDGGLYGLMSGTSMACPQVAGVTALVLQYLKEKFPDATEAQMRVLVDSLLMSTAVTVVDNDSGVEASPRQQGAGLVDAFNAITAEAYLTVEGSERPKAELGDSADGTFSFTFTVNNFSDSAKTYTLSSSLLCEDYVEDEYLPGLYFMAEEDRALDNSAVSFSQNTVTVEAGGSATVTVTINLTEADKTWIETYFPNGNYVEGYVYLKGEEEVTLSVPFLGFYGNWDAAPLFDIGYWYQPGVWIDDYPYIENFMYYHILWTSLGTSDSDWLLGFNPYEYTYFEFDEQGNPINVVYDPANNVLSPNGDGVLDQLTNFYISLMRNAEHLYFTYTDEEGNVLHEMDLQKESKTMYISGYGGTVPFVYSWYYNAEHLYDFTDAEGNYLPDGTTVYLTISGVIDYEGAEEDFMATIPLHMDSTAPVLDEANVIESTDENGNYITLTFAEEHPAFAAIMNKSGTQVYSRYSELDMVDNGDGTYSLTLDVTGLGDNFVVCLADYGCNEAYYELTYTLVDNDPVMDLDALYAYQVMNDYILYTQGYDYMFGWSTIDKETAVVEMLQSDAYEYYALIAAEYAGGYVFAVDAGYNFMYMVPGLWNRNVICNLGVNVVDMAFDEVSQTMYLTVKDNENYVFGLYTIDLLTGEMIQVCSYLSAYEMPWAMTFVNGELYCCKYYYSGFYKVNLEDGSGELVPVTDANGNAFNPADSTGDAVSPLYSQSMTYSQKDGKIYWAYYSLDGMGVPTHELITIDPATWTYSAVPFYFDQEYVGLLTLEDDGYTLPESSEVLYMNISDELLVMSTNEMHTLTVSMLPWNAPITQDLIWTSSDENVAIVENGTIYTVGEGIAVITATYGDLSVSCTVNVVNVSGNVYAYNYYSGDGSYGTWMNIDLETVEPEYIAYSPVDFIAADYNGHTGLIYGFDEHGRCYCYDPATGDCITLASASVVPADMAYDYTTGLMYVIAYDFMTWSTTLYNLNMNTGALVEVATGYDIYLTLACDMYGCLYGINYFGELHMLLVDASGGGGIGGGGIAPWSFGVETSPMMYGEFLMQTPVTELFYAQSMCYDHNNDVILWTSPEHSTVYWLDVWAETPFAVALGDPSGSGLIEYTSMFVVPEVIPELPYFPVESVEAEDMTVLVGTEKLPAVSVHPLNATNSGNVTYVSADESIAKVENGMIVGVSAGTTTVTATVEDDDYTFECTFTVSVKNSTDNIIGYLMTDLGNYDGYYWMELDDEVPSAYTPIDYVNCNGTYMLLYAAEYIDGYIYAYGFDDQDWNANFHYMVIDTRTWSVIDYTDMGDEFPFVYDMAYDYTTGTMYALAGTVSATSLYIVNMANGELIESTVSDQMFMNLAIDGNGTIYAMAPSVEEFDWWTWTSTYSNAVLYTIDPVNGTYEPIMDTGCRSNMISSMAYDYDTGYIYWTGLFQGAKYESGLYLIDLADMTCNNLGTIGGAGAQVSSLMVIADNYPEVPTELQNMVMTNPYVEVFVGNNVVVETFLQPSFAAVDMVWTSADESIAVVDENGVVTGIAPGSTTITVVANGGEKSVVASCTVFVYGENDYFLTYNVTDGGFSAIGRPDPTVVTNLTEAEQNASVRSMAMVDGLIYAYDENGNLFVTSVENGFRREYIGNCGIEVAAPYERISAGYYTYYYTYTPNFVIRDMAWDAANGRMLAVGCFGVDQESYYTSGSYTSSTSYNFMEEDDGCRLYEVDLETGALTELCVIGGASSVSGVQMLTVTGSGDVYSYSSFADYMMKLNPETGDVEYLSTFQNLGMYGSSDGDPMALVYDPATENIYVLFTENGNLYYLYKFNPKTTALNRVNVIGGEYDHFAGLIVNQSSQTSQTPEQSGESEEHKQNHPDHVFRTIVIAPDCDSWGCTLHVCTSDDCKESYATNYVTAIGHNHVTEKVDATCTDGGYISCTCLDCGESFNLVEMDALGHDYKTVVTDATCTEGGHTTYTCARCDDTYVADETVAKGHTDTEPVKENVVEATCTVDGSYELVVYCAACGIELSRESVVEPAAGHVAGEAVQENVVDATCATDGSYESVVYCQTCNAELSRETVTVPAVGHTAGEAVTENAVDATCGADGSYELVVYCQICEAELSRETVVVPATGEHVFSTETERKEATCTEDGYVIMACGCGATETTVIPAVEHIAGEAVVENEKAATCTEDGSYALVVYCQTCNAELSRETVAIPMVAHVAGEWEIVKDSTTTEVGLQQQKCTVCGAVVAEDVIPVKEDSAGTGDNTFVFVIFAMMAMTGAVVVVSRKKYF